MTDRKEEISTSTHPNLLFLPLFPPLIVVLCADQPDRFARQEEVDVVRHKVNFQLKCKMCGRLHTADIIKGSEKDYVAEHSGSPHPIVSLDCRSVSFDDLFLFSSFSSLRTDLQDDRDDRDGG